MAETPNQQESQHRIANQLTQLNAALTPVLTALPGLLQGSVDATKAVEGTLDRRLDQILANERNLLGAVRGMQEQLKVLVAHVTGTTPEPPEEEDGEGDGQPV